jgi:hypothetical protein
VVNSTSSARRSSSSRTVFVRFQLIGAIDKPKRRPLTSFCTVSASGVTSRSSLERWLSLATTTEIAVSTRFRRLPMVPRMLRVPAQRTRSAGVRPAMPRFIPSLTWNSAPT